jgi:hypothetical protein
MAMLRVAAVNSALRPGLRLNVVRPVAMLVALAWKQFYRKLVTSAKGLFLIEL